MEWHQFRSCPRPAGWRGKRPRGVVPASRSEQGLADAQDSGRARPARRHVFWPGCQRRFHRARGGARNSTDDIGAAQIGQHLGADAAGARPLVRRRRSWPPTATALPVRTACAASSSVAGGRRQVAAEPSRGRRRAPRHLGGECHAAAAQPFISSCRRQASSVPPSTSPSPKSSSSKYYGQPPPPSLPPLPSFQRSDDDPCNAEEGDFSAMLQAIRSKATSRVVKGPSSF